MSSGTPNASSPYSQPANEALLHPNGYCPGPDYMHDSSGTLWQGPFCVQPSLTMTAPYQHLSVFPFATPRANTPDYYTSLDYALDLANWLSDPDNGVGASIYSIGLGNRVEHAHQGAADEAEQFMKYASLYAGGPHANHGQYYYDDNPSDFNALKDIFNQIYDNITTRLAY